MQERDHLTLQLGVEIDEDVSTADEIELGKGRVTGEVVLHEHADVADALADLVAALDAIEEAGQSFASHADHRCLWITADAGRLDGLLTQVGAEDLDGDTLGPAIQGLEEADGERVDFLARRASRNPDSDRIAVVLALREWSEDLLLQRGEGIWIAEEGRDVNEHVLRQRRGLVRGVAEQSGVFIQPTDPLQRHTPLDAPEHRRPLVAGKIDARLLP